MEADGLQCAQSRFTARTGALDFDFENYDRIMEAPTVARGAKAIGMKRLSEWLYRPRHFSTIESEYTHPYCRPM